MNRSYILLILGIIGIIVILSIVAFGSQSIEYKGLCVDGNGDVNLEGIMCEKSYESFFGCSEEISSVIGILFIFLILMFGLIIMTGLMNG